MVFLYILLFSFPQGKEIIIVPIWYKNVSRTNIEQKVNSSSGQLISFMLDKLFGFIDLDGNVSYLEKRNFYTTISTNQFINYGAIPGNYFVKDSLGKIKYAFRSYGYPVLSNSGKTIVLLTTDLTGLKVLNSAGEETFNEEFSSLITSLKFNDSMILIGLLDGETFLKDINGRTIFYLKTEKNKSNIPVTVGVALSGDNSRIAVLHDLHPQKLSIAEKGKSGYKIVHVINTETNYNREVMINFSYDGKYLICPKGKGVLLIDTDTWEMEFLSLEAEMTDMAVSNTDNLFSFISQNRNNGNYYFKVVFPLKKTVYQKQFYQKIQFIKIVENHIFLGLDNAIIRLDLKRI